ncbi:hypothetical protein HHK36_021717 [Tetracentron sinense]|uniref:Uncharacterized protein n=1 Tax=Tetracentron sinense TaxID=13715 RepID=A0A834YVL7_TETSI|nr:hypothetical protein HHK36_021717 [Tetracentron sinense]
MMVSHSCLIKAAIKLELDYRELSVAQDDPVPQTETKSPKSAVMNSITADSFAAVLLNNFDGSAVKSGIWADALNYRLINLNVSASKELSLADVGIVGGLSDGSDEKEMGPLSSAYMGRAGSTIGGPAFTSTSMSGCDVFSNLS